MNENKTPLKSKVSNFFVKHERTISVIQVSLISIAAGIIIQKLDSEIREAQEWNEMENDEFFKDAELITKTRDGRFYRFNSINKEENEDA